MQTLFGSLLRRYRLAASLTQVELARAAGISVSAIGSYERGINAAPHRNAVRLLVEALRLTGAQRAEFEKAARPKIRDKRERVVSAVIDNLPAESTSFIGRVADVARLHDMLTRKRCATITGIGGIGKTRVAIRTARGLKNAFRDGVAFVDLSAIHDDELIVAHIASATKIAPSGDSPGVDDFAKQLGDLELLLVVDNCEHLLSKTATVLSAILRFAPSITVLATSRERLRIAGENVYRLSTLSLPDASARNADEAGRFEAVQLFVERATALDQHFRLTDARAELIAAVCRKLDGVPLAIELAAARVATLGLRTLLEQLRHAIALLSHGNRDIPSRQRTLEATLAWSYHLLEPNEQALFRRLSVFAGGWTLKAAQHVCADLSIVPETILDALSSLVEKSLIHVDLDLEEPRYDMLQVTRSFVLAETAARGEVAYNAHRHATWLAETSRHYIGEGRFLPYPRAEPFSVADIDNMRAAAEWCLQTPETALLAAAFLFGSTHLWWQRGVKGEYEHLVRLTLARIDAETNPLESGWLHRLLATESEGDEKIAEARLAVRAFTIAGDRRRAADATVQLAVGMNSSNRSAEAKGHIAFALSELLATNCQGSLAHGEALRISAYLAAYGGAFEEARRQMNEAAAIFEALLGEDAATIQCFSGLVEFEFICGDANAALQGADRFIEIARRTQHQGSLYVMLCNRAGYNLSLRRVDAARVDAREALALARHTDRVCTLTAIQHLATVAALTNMPDASARLIGFVDRENASLGRTNEIPEDICLQILIEALRPQLTGQQLSDLKSDGGRLENDDSIELALSV